MVSGRLMGREQTMVANDFKELLDAARNGTLRRRDVLRRALGLGLSAPAITALLAACGDDDDDDGEAEEPGSDDSDEPTATSADGGDAEEADEDDDDEEDEDEDEEGAGAGDGEPVRGGTLRVALIGEPPTLDIHQTTATIVSLVTWHIYEPLFTWDESFQILPMLAESHEVSEDGLTNTVVLRQGVAFHNGKEMTSADVIASIERWGEISGLGQNLLEATDSITAADDYTIEFAMNRPFGAFLTVLARQNQGCAIFPQESIDAVGTDPLEEFIGTGPYMFVERQADRYIRVARYEDYSPQTGEPNGYGGAHGQYADEIEFVPVPDEAARIAGLQAGDYDYLESISPDQSSTLEGDPNVVVEQTGATGWETFVLNTSEGIMTNVTLRQAILAAIDPEPILFAGQGEGFYRIDPGVMVQETAWHSTVGEDMYAQADPDRARELAEEAGYDGTPIRFMTTQEYRDMFNQSVVAQQQLEAAGFTVDQIVHDWATLVENRSDETYWDIFTTGITFRPDPVMLPFMQGCGWPGWWCSDRKNELTEQLQGESEFEARKAVWDELQALFYEEVPHVKLGDALGIAAYSARMKGGLSMFQLAPVFWNNWLEE
ncbi:ABC transporter substrate-binding protein [soil metagenome]